MSQTGGCDGVALVFNAGSSSLKAALFGADDALLWKEHWNWNAAAHPGSELSPEAVLQACVMERLEEWRGHLTLIGHRLVHGGSDFTATTALDGHVLQRLQELQVLAPLHNAPALRVIRWLAARLPATSQWACFDTAFHRTLPPQACTYALPSSWRTLGLRRYGFHGLNHQHISEVAQRQEGTRSSAPLRLISCHLGAGCSLCAIRGGDSIATTMGYTPLDGLVMSTRCGSVDPGILLAMLRRGISPSEMEQQLQSESGLLGLSQLSGNMQELRQAAAAGHEGAKLAIAVFRERLLQGIGAMAASLRGVDVIALSGGIGEHDTTLQAELAQELSWLGSFRLLIVPADEEGVIARNCRMAQSSQLSDRIMAQPRTSTGRDLDASTAEELNGRANQ